ncbi:MAG: GTPase HflX [Deltaproteobacteria bacterium]|jgi:GTP-binding protein HflX
MRPLDGHTQGLKARQTKRIQATFRRKVRGDELVSGELSRHVADLSREVNRQLGLLIDRGGHIVRVIVGEPSRLYLPDIGRTRGGQGRLRGLRLIRTELRGQGLTREDLADLSKLRLDAVVVIEVDPGGNPQQAHWAHLDPDRRDKAVKPREETVRSVYELPENGMQLVFDAEAEMSRLFAGDAQRVARDSAMLVGVWASAPKVRQQAEDSMTELEELARTAGVHIVDSVIQVRRQIDPRTVLGRGKIEEITLRALELGAEIIIFDRDLSPSQLRAITNETDLKVIDRTQLILDIFAQHAKSRDGKLQVELAQLKYTLPRLIEKSTAMSRLTGGIGGQGPGETKLEIHRRRARDRIHALEQQIEKLSVQRNVRRKRRHANNVPVVSIVGYTNAGKSTLLNALTNAEVIAENKLFATLDTTTRRLRFPEEEEIILTDTVGFIRDLPQDLVNAFKATLEELVESDLILHVIDGSDSLVDQKRKAVEAILVELGVDAIERLVVINKIDATPRPMVSALKRVTGGVAISAQDRVGFEALTEAIRERVFANKPDVGSDVAVVASNAH